MLPQPDSLLVGSTPCSDAARKSGMSCSVLTHDEEQTQMALWSMASAPLQMSNDLRAVPAASRAILLNREVIAVQSDPLGRMCFRFMANETSGAQGWRKELLGGEVAVALVNMGSTHALSIGFELRDAGFAPDTNVRVRDLFKAQEIGVFAGAFRPSAPLAPHAVQMLRLSFEPQYKAGL